MKELINSGLFKAMQNNKFLKRKDNGSGVDINALVKALADTCDLMKMTDHLFIQM